MVARKVWGLNPPFFLAVTVELMFGKYRLRTKLIHTNRESRHSVQGLPYTDGFSKSGHFWAVLLRAPGSQSDCKQSDNRGTTNQETYASNCSSRHDFDEGMARDDATPWAGERALSGGMKFTQGSGWICS